MEFEGRFQVETAPHVNGDDETPHSNEYSCFPPPLPGPLTESQSHRLVIRCPVTAGPSNSQDGTDRRPLRNPRGGVYRTPGRPRRRCHYSEVVANFALEDAAPEVSIGRSTYRPPPTLSPAGIASAAVIATARPSVLFKPPSHSERAQVSLSPPLTQRTALPPVARPSNRMRYRHQLGLRATVIQVRLQHPPPLEISRHEL